MENQTKTKWQHNRHHYHDVPLCNDFIRKLTLQLQLVSFGRMLLQVTVPTQSACWVMQ
jgi:hypothetical protein